MLSIPHAVKAAAKEGQKMIDRGYKGGTDTGWRRAEQLSTQEAISLQDAMMMRAWFARHYATSRPNYVKWLQADKEQKRNKNAWRGAIAWLIWGGDFAYKWIMASSVQKEIVDWGARNGKTLKDRVPQMPLTV